mgnify:CR=1 FL=1
MNPLSQFHPFSILSPNVKAYHGVSEGGANGIDSADWIWFQNARCAGIRQVLSLSLIPFLFTTAALESPAGEVGEVEFALVHSLLSQNSLSLAQRLLNSISFPYRRIGAATNSMSFNMG